MDRVHAPNEFPRMQVSSKVVLDCVSPSVPMELWVLSKKYGLGSHKFPHGPSVGYRRGDAEFPKIPRNVPVDCDPESIPIIISQANVELAPCQSQD